PADRRIQGAWASVCPPRRALCLRWETAMNRFRRLKFGESIGLAPRSSGERPLRRSFRLLWTCLIRVGSTAETCGIAGWSVRRGEAACEVDEYIGEVLEGSGFEAPDGLLGDRVPCGSQSRQQRPTLVGELDDRRAPVG